MHIRTLPFRFWTSSGTAAALLIAKHAPHLKTFNYSNKLTLFFLCDTLSKESNFRQLYILS
ncbi:hypothetical protein C1A50_1416 [Paenibacillus polymyxa]|nr:hypothetical protein C1A50_1416 [Paenibacillus polymyxa]